MLPANDADFPDVTNLIYLFCYLSPVRIAKMKTQGTADDGEDVEKEEHFSIVGGIASW